MDTFVWKVHTDYNVDVEDNVSTTNFGDGYKQEVVLGLNPEKSSYKTNISGNLQFVRTVRAFLVANIGKSFMWKEPITGQMIPVVCKQRSMRLEGSKYAVLSMTFERSYLP